MSGVAAVTGATGFIGSHVARLIVEESHEVHAVVRPDSDLWRIADVASRLKLIRCDLLDDAAVMKGGD